MIAAPEVSAVDDTANRLAAGLLRLNPGKRFAYHRDGYAVAVWNAALARWQACISLSRAIGGEWVTLEYEPLINGRPACSELDWQECQREDACPPCTSPSAAWPLPPSTPATAATEAGESWSRCSPDRRWTT